MKTTILIKERSASAKVHFFFENNSKIKELGVSQCIMDRLKEKWVTESIGAKIRILRSVLF